MLNKFKKLSVFHKLVVLVSFLFGLWYIQKFIEDLFLVLTNKDLNLSFLSILYLIFGIVCFLATYVLLKKNIFLFKILYYWCIVNIILSLVAVGLMILELISSYSIPYSPDDYGGVIGFFLILGLLADLFPYTILMIIYGLISNKGIKFKI